MLRIKDLWVLAVIPVAYIAWELGDTTISQYEIQRQCDWLTDQERTYIRLLMAWAFTFFTINITYLISHKNRTNRYHNYELDEVWDFKLFRLLPNEVVVRYTDVVDEPIAYSLSTFSSTKGSTENKVFIAEVIGLSLMILIHGLIFNYHMPIWEMAVYAVMIVGFGMVAFAESSGNKWSIFHVIGINSALIAIYVDFFINDRANGQIFVICVILTGIFILFNGILTPIVDKTEKIGVKYVVSIVSISSEIALIFNLLFKFFMCI